MAESSARLLQRPDIQVIWQCGQSHYARFRECPAALLPQVCLLPFLERMDMAYAAADVVACRAGALTISELCILGKAAVLVPSPYVAEDHQTKNAEALVIRGAAKMVKNESAGKIMLPVAIELLTDTELRHSLERNIRALAQPDAAEAIADEAIALCNVGN
jgi:UDP-N-acetylglucosamine--N-acetylmuramyl-(pentapeptide) pyrophosphoryl-undecaprenol N-acetylglucosamine transferase